MLHWAELTGNTISAEYASEAVELIVKKFPDDNIRIGRRIYQNAFSRVQAADGSWGRGEAEYFSLLEKVSVVGAESPFLKAQWQKTKERIQKQEQLAPFLVGVL